MKTPRGTAAFLHPPHFRPQWPDKSTASISAALEEVGNGRAKHFGHRRIATISKGVS